MIRLQAMTILVAFLVRFPLTLSAVAQEANAKPNIVLIFIDDMGYADIGPFGAKGYSTPNLDRMAERGRRFTNFIVSSAVCSASRAALMTGCIHERVGFRGALGPQARQGISKEETTIAEICKTLGYATACFGKWHLGHHPEFLPTRHGFDRYYGLPYSNDMWPFHPEVLAAKKSNASNKSMYPPLPMIENDRVVDEEVTGEDQARMTVEYTQRAVNFIDENATKPFFLYMPHSMVHVPLYSSPQFANKSPQGPYADAVMEIDWSVGQVMKALEEKKLVDRTLVIFSSDNGPWLSYGSHAGSAGPLREGKGSVWEGGIRVPTMMQWPGRIPANSRCDELASTIDVLPTVTSLIGGALPARKIDGKDIRPLLLNDQPSASPHTTLPCYYADGQLQAIRSPRWKLVLPHTYRSIEGGRRNTDGTPVAYSQKKIVEPELYDLIADVGERTNVASSNSDVVDWLQKEADSWRTELGDSLKKMEGTQVRPTAKLTE
jgi:arylsulfatase A